MLLINFLIDGTVSCNSFIVAVHQPQPQFLFNKVCATYEVEVGAIGYVFCMLLSMHLCFCLCIRDYMFPRYFQYLLMDFCQTLISGASWDKDELIRFWE